MTNRRNFLKNSATISASMLMDHTMPASFLKKMDKIANSLILPNELSLKKDDDFWSYIRESYTTSSTIINLNNG